MGALVTVMVPPHLTDGCAVARDAATALVANGWTAPEERKSLQGTEKLAAVVHRIDRLQARTGHGDLSNKGRSAKGTTHCPRQFPDLLGAEDALDILIGADIESLSTSVHFFTPP